MIGSILIKLVRLLENGLKYNFIQTVGCCWLSKAKPRRAKSRKIRRFFFIRTQYTRVQFLYLLYLIHVQIFKSFQISFHWKQSTSNICKKLNHRAIKKVVLCILYFCLWISNNFLFRTFQFLWELATSNRCASGRVLGIVNNSTLL